MPRMVTCRAIAPAQGHQHAAIRSASIVAASVSHSFAFATQAARDASSRLRSVRSVVEMPKRSSTGITTGCSVINVSMVTLQEIGRGYWVMCGVYALHVGIESRARHAASHQSDSGALHSGHWIFANTSQSMTSFAVVGHVESPGRIAP